MASFIFPTRESHLSPPYQLHATKAANPQSVDDVEIGQIEIEEKSILGFVPADGVKEEDGEEGGERGRGGGRQDKERD